MSERWEKETETFSLIGRAVDRIKVMTIGMPFDIKSPIESNAILRSRNMKHVMRGKVKRFWLSFY